MQDGWVPTVCYGCYNACGVLARRVDGVVTEITGDPQNPSSLGHVCAKGKARIADLYDPDRVKKPLRRRNPEKGRGVDPRWEEISWDEALAALTKRLLAARDKDPRGIVVAHFDIQAAAVVRAWATAVGTPHSNWSSAGLFCGMGSHTVNMLINGSYNSEIDFEHCNHIVLVGTQMGFMVDSNAQATTHHCALARKRGAKLTVIDPVCGAAAAKADTWLPVRPGTDAALGLGIVNQLLNVLQVFDAEFLRKRTNAPYLIRPDGHYLRDPESSKPLVFDVQSGRAVPYDSCAPERMALEGKYLLNDVEARPAFVLLKEHVARYDSESVSRITGLEKTSIEKLAAELAHDACIGRTITIDGKELPYRPVAVNFKMGAVGHKHGMATGIALHLINIVLGAIDVPGGFLGVNPVGPTWAPEIGPDGLLVTSEHIRSLYGYNATYPGSAVRPPETLSLQELFPVAVGGRTMYPFTLLHGDDFGLDFTPEILLQCRVNLMMSMVDPQKIGEALKRIPFIVSFATHLDETAEFADLVLPDAHDLERADLFPGNHPYAFLVPGPGVWYGARRQQVVPPAGEARHWCDVLIDLAYRMGLRADLHEVFNAILELEGPQALPPEGSFTVGDIGLRQVQKAAGDEAPKVGAINGSGTFRLRAKHIEEAYPGPWIKPRLPIYQEYLLAKGEEVRDALEGRNVRWDTSDYAALPDWRPSAADAEDAGQFDMYAVPFKLPFLGLSLAAENPWIADLGERHPYAFRLMMHRSAADARGIRQGDEVVVTSRVGEITGRVYLTEAIRRDTVAIAGISGHWAKGMPRAKGRGLHFNSLVALDLENIDKLSSAFDSKVKVRVTRAKTAPPEGGRSVLKRAAALFLPLGWLQ
ncbi:MAG: molybdopterin-dependent oxidoreductase [Burkholderiaceae bacterium]|nr:molybdopterin-dependent oxidoreductase [Burkholderiaceae bacterium]